MDENIEIIEIGEPDLTEVSIKDADQVVEVEHESSGVGKKYGSESLANAFVSALSMGSMAATKYTGTDMNMTEDEAGELHEAMREFGDSMGGVDLPPSLVLLLVTGTFVGGRFVTYLMESQKVVNKGAENVEVITD